MNVGAMKHKEAVQLVTPRKCTFSFDRITSEARFCISRE